MNAQHQFRRAGGYENPPDKEWDPTSRSHRALSGAIRTAGCWLAVLLLSLGASRAGEQADAATPRIVRVVLDKNYSPYSFQSDDGRLQGILVDQWQLWEKKTGIKVAITALDWAEAVRRMRGGDFDVIDTIVETEDRRAYFDFTPEYATIEVPIFFRRDISGITDMASLKGFPVGVKAGDQHIDRLRASGVTTVIPFPNFTALIEAARQRKISVFVADAPTALHLLNKAGLGADFRQSAPLFRDGLQRAVRKGDAALFHAVMQGFAAIDPGELKQIDEKWFGRTLNWSGRYLTYLGYAAAAAALLIAGLAGWNLTLRKEVQVRTAALGESEQRFRQIAENIREVFWLATFDREKILYVSPTYEAVWGRSRESLYDDPDSFVRAIHPEDRRRALAAIERDREHGFDVEFRVIRPDGSIRWIWDRGFPIRDEAAHAYRIAGIAEDITERKLAADAVKQAENRIRLVLDTIPTMAWSVQPDGAIDFVNQRWLDYTGLSRENEIKDPTTTIYPSDLPRVMEKWFASKSAEEPFEDEMRLLRADGEYRWVLVRTVPLRDEQGNIVKWFGASIDIGDRKEAEETLRRNEQQLQALVGRLNTVREDEAKHIARELHDDLGQKLTALNMGLADLERKLVDATPGQRAQIAGMHATVDQTIEAVQEISSGLRLGQLDILGLTAAIDWQMKEFSLRSGIPCRMTRLDEITNLSDEQRTAVFRILQEALTNIVRHAGATQVEISMQAGPDRLVLKVHDNGRGITAAELSDRKAIGLLGMRERAQLVGGEVTVTGGAGMGTTMLVTIPLQHPTEPSP